MNTGETKECVHLTQRKTRCCSTGFFYSVLVEGGLNLRLAALFSLTRTDLHLTLPAPGDPTYTRTESLQSIISKRFVSSNPL